MEFSDEMNYERVVQIEKIDTGMCCEKRKKEMKMRQEVREKRIPRQRILAPAATLQMRSRSG